VKARQVFGILLAAMSEHAIALPTEPTVAGLPPHEIGTAGAVVPFLEYEAEEAESNAIPLGPDRREGSLAAEASGRRAALLDQPSHSIAFTLAAPANALTIRFALPDSTDGKGTSGQLAVEAESERVATVAVSSRYSWFYGRYPFSNRPGDGSAHHFWDEVRVRLPRTFAAGSRLVLSNARPSSRKRWIAIDLVDTEVVPPPVPAPANALSVMEFGADSSGLKDSRGAFLRAVRSAQKQRRPLYIPPGRFRVDRHLVVDRVTVIGAGPWHSVVAGAGIGFYASKPRGSEDVWLSNFAIESDVTERRDHAPLAAIGGVFSRSTFSDLFVHHSKVGVWIDGPASAITIRRLRITDQTADGINLHRGITGALVEQNFIRNVGDDGIALWSERVPNSKITVRSNSVAAPLLANGIAIYGGRDIVVRDNLVADTVTQGGGIHFGARFKATPFSGTIEVSGNMLVRTGSLDPNWHFGVGALWFYALERPISDALITIRDTLALDSSCEAIQLLGPYAISGIRINGLKAIQSGDAVLSIQAPGSIFMSRISNSGRGAPDTMQLPDGFELSDGGLNSGWSSVRLAAPDLPKCKVM
jgi:hypothetical protein